MTGSSSLLYKRFIFETQLQVDWRLSSATEARPFTRAALCFSFVCTACLWPFDFLLSSAVHGFTQEERATLDACQSGHQNAKILLVCWIKVGSREKSWPIGGRLMFMSGVQSCSVGLGPVLAACLGSMWRYVYDQLNGTWLLVLWSWQKLEKYDKACPFRPD